MYLAFAYIWDLHQVLEISVVLSDFMNSTAVFSRLNARTAGVFPDLLRGGENGRVTFICSALNNMLNILHTASCAEQQNSAKLTLKNDNVKCVGSWGGQS